jgi:hypothetical protein
MEKRQIRKVKIHDFSIIQQIWGLYASPSTNRRNMWFSVNDLNMNPLLLTRSLEPLGSYVMKRY